MTKQNDRDRPQQNRRDLLRGGLAVALALAGYTARGTVLAANLVEADTPGLTEGPYWVDELLQRSDVRSDPTTGAIQPGLPLALAVNVSELNADGSVTPLPGAFVDIWHANASGTYSDIAAEGTEGLKYLRGYQISNAHGNVKFLSIYPGWYSGRTPHIHARVRVFDPSTATVEYNFTTQFFFDDAISQDVYRNVAPYNTRTTQDTLNAADGIFTGGSADGSPAADAGQSLLLRLFENRTRATASFNIVIDLTNTANEDDGSGAPGGGTPPGGGAPPGGGMPPGDPPPGVPPPGGPPTVDARPAPGRDPILIASRPSVLRA